MPQNFHGVMKEKFTDSKNPMNPKQNKYIGKHLHTSNTVKLLKSKNMQKYLKSHQRNMTHCIKMNNNSNYQGLLIRNYGNQKIVGWHLKEQKQKKSN